MARANPGNRAVGAPEPERRAYATRGLAELVPALTRAAYRKRSPAGALLMSEWGAVVGPRLAGATEPRKLVGTQLTIACAGPVALELQHVATTLIERINTHAGRTLVERLRFVQEPLGDEPFAPPHPRPVSLERVEGVEDGSLNDALARLRAAMRAAMLANGA